MLMLLFYINNERYALACEQVIEILPLVTLKPLHQTPNYLAGVFNYQGNIVPVIDLSQFITGKNCVEHMSTRIILINYWESQDSSTLETTQKPKLIGLLAERVVETLHKSADQFVDLNIQIGQISFLGKMLTDEQGMIQFLPINDLLSAAEKINYQLNILPEVKSN